MLRKLPLVLLSLICPFLVDYYGTAQGKQSPGVSPTTTSWQNSAAAQDPAAALAASRQQALSLIRDKKATQALKILTADSKKNSNDPEVWRLLGLAYFELSELKKAVKAYQKSLNLKPNQPEALVGLGYIYYFAAELAQAEKETQTALTFDPKHFDANYLMALIKLRQSENVAALKHTEVLIEQNPNFPEAYLLRSQAYVLGGFAVVQDKKQDVRPTNYRIAIEALEKYLSLNPASSEVGLWKSQLEGLKIHLAVLVDEEKAFGVPRRASETGLRLISKPVPAYTLEARQSGVLGRVVLRAVFSSEGVVKHIIVILGLPKGLTARAIDAASKIEFTPAMANGKPISRIIQLEYNFNLY